MNRDRTSTAFGLSLIEVLVALVVLALALATATQAISGWLATAARQGETLRAQWCADNALNQLRLSRQWPGIGQQSQTCEQAGQALTVNLNVQPTPNPSFLRVSAQVINARHPILTVNAILGRY